MSEQIRGRVQTKAADDKGTPDACPEEFSALGAEIVDLLYTQTLSPDAISTPAQVCAAFSDMILRHWDLCCIVIYLRDEGGQLRETAVHTHEHLDEEKARAAGAQFAAAAERRGGEVQNFLDEDGADGQTKGRQLRRALEEADLRAGAAVPIHARGMVVGALVAVQLLP